MDFYDRAELARKVNDLFELTAERRELAKKEKALKAFFKSKFPEGTVYHTGLHILSVIPGVKESVDRARLATDLGEELLKPYISETPFLTVNVVPSQAQLSSPQPVAH